MQEIKQAIVIGWIFFSRVSTVRYNNVPSFLLIKTTKLDHTGVTMTTIMYQSEMHEEILVRSKQVDIASYSLQQSFPDTY